MNTAAFLKHSNEGTRSPFVARLFLGMLEIRNLLELGNIDPRNKQISRQQFDKFHFSLFLALHAARDAAFEIIETISNHTESLAKGQIVTIQQNAFTVNGTVDFKLNQAVGKLLDHGSIAFKDRLQEIVRCLYDLDIGFLYQRQDNYEKGLADFRENVSSEFADYLGNVRTAWLHEFQELRNDREHKGWTLGQVQYLFSPPEKVTAVFPELGKLQVDEYARRSANRICLFVENVIAYGFQIFNRSPIFLVEIPKEMRDPSNCQRFRAAPKGMPGFGQPWQLIFKDDLDFV